MIIDADVHLSPLSEYETNMNAEMLVESMEEAGVDKALCWIHRPYVRSMLPEVQRYLYQSTKRYPDKILGFGWIDPRLGKEKAIDELHRCLYEYGFYGVKFNGAQNEHMNDDSEMVLPLVEEIAKCNAVLALHTGADAYEWTHPHRVRNIAKRYSDLKILMVHMGGAALSDLSVSAIEVAKECPNVMIIGSDIRARSLLRGIREVGPDRICFGSDTPFEVMRAETAKYKALLQGVVTEEEKELIFHENISRVLGLK